MTRVAVEPSRLVRVTRLRLGFRVGVRVVLRVQVEVGVRVRFRFRVRVRVRVRARVRVRVRVTGGYLRPLWADSWLVSTTQLPTPNPNYT